jgi:Pyruvate/2-oxoacid:ferredoxin oxidoreductase delta subunit
VKPATAKPPPVTLALAIYEGQGSAPLAPEQRSTLLASLLGKGYRVTVGGEVACDQANLLVLGHFAGAAPEPRQDANGVVVRFADVEGKDADAVLAAVKEAEAAIGGTAPGTWKPWFPVIDYDRCTNCMQCLSFCLFDVYGVDTAGKLAVQNPSNCKTNCPACSRVCPEVAIVFPKYKSGPINGEPVNVDDIRREHMKVDISALLGGNIYAALRDRSIKAQSRFSKERDADRALAERTRCLEKLREALDIPPELLQSLPDADTINAKKLIAMRRAGLDA